MNATHHNGILHNDLVKDNIMLFSLNKPDIVCNWGEVECMQEEQDVINMKKVH
jgi:tRNA A-37 threonylcarbamoyl transferase component Bud32